MAKPAAKSNITQLLLSYGEGNSQALEELLPQVYDELRRLAAHYMRKERAGHTLAPTILVHEAFLRLFDLQTIKWESRRHFFGAAAQLMRRVLIDHARAKRAQKRGGGEIKLTLEEDRLASVETAPDVLALDEALKKLAAVDERRSRIVELRYFGGLSLEETAEVMNSSVATVKRDWMVARTWLYRELSQENSD